MEGENQRSKRETWKGGGGNNLSIRLLEREKEID